MNYDRNSGFALSLLSFDVGRNLGPIGSSVHGEFSNLLAIGLYEPFELSGHFRTTKVALGRNRSVLQTESQPASMEAPDVLVTT